MAHEDYKRQKVGGIAMIVGGALMIGGGIAMATGDSDASLLYGGMLTGIGVGINVGGIIVLVKAKRHQRELRSLETRPLTAGEKPQAIPLK